MILKEDDLKNLVWGSALLGSGGGGSIQAGMDFVAYIVTKTGGAGVGLQPFPLPSSALGKAGCVIADIGAITAIEDDQASAVVGAIERLSEHNSTRGQKPISFVLPVETGAENTLVPFVAATVNGLTVLDGDGGGRAVPQLQLSTFGALPPCPAVIANDQGDTVLIETGDAESLDGMLRPIVSSSKFGDSACLALWSAPVETLGDACVQGSVSMALSCGRLLHRLTNGGQVDAQDLQRANSQQASILAQGKVTRVSQAETGGFNFGRVSLRDDFTGGLVTLFFQNENLIVYNELSQAPLLTAPASIAYLGKDGRPLTNSEIKAGDEVFVIGIEPHAALTGARLLAGFRDVLVEVGFAGQLAYRLTDARGLGDVLLEIAGSFGDQRKF